MEETTTKKIWFIFNKKKKIKYLNIYNLLNLLNWEIKIN